MATAVMSLPQIPSGSPPLDEAAMNLQEKLYKVKNVDDKGRIIHVGFLEVADSYICFQYQHYPTERMQWPLTCIRKYGSNSKGNLFIIEAGRRAPQGEGLYAFRTKEADEIRKKIDQYARKF